MPGILRIISLTEGNSELGVLDSGSATLGREPENQIQIDSAGVSRQHGAVFLAGSQWCYRDNASTNGSWLNSEKLPPESIRLLRNKDVIKMADYLCQIVIERQSEGSSGISLLVFDERGFHSESPLVSPEAVFTIGGPAGILSLTDSADEPESLSISLLGPRAMLRVGAGETVILNTSRAQGERTLTDRDAIMVGRYQILVNDPATAVEYKIPVAPLVTPIKSGGVSGTIGIGAPAMSRGNPSYDDWQSEAAKRKSDGRKFIFGAEQEQGVEELGERPEMRRSSFEMNLSQRVPTVTVREIDPSTRKFHVAIYGIVFVLFMLLVGLLVFIIRVVS